MATIEPGFTADEDREELGSNLTPRTPERLENGRGWIKARLPAFDGLPVED